VDPVPGRRDTGQPVSREDVEVVRAIHERWRRGDSARELFDPEIEWSTPHPDASAIAAARKLLAFLRTYAGTWQDYRIELEAERLLPNLADHAAAQERLGRLAQLPRISTPHSAQLRALTS
jgi:hypothetical protein